jgi:hypothetical protein
MPPFGYVFPLPEPDGLCQLPFRSDKGYKVSLQKEGNVLYWYLSEMFRDIHRADEKSRVAPKDIDID